MLIAFHGYMGFRHVTNPPPVSFILFNLIDNCSHVRFDRTSREHSMDKVNGFQ